LAGSLVSAALKSCCESLFESDSFIGAAELLILLNKSLSQHDKPALSSCFVAVFNPEESVVHYSNAGHPVPYRLSKENEGLQVLTSSGPLLGHVANYKFRQASCSFASGDLFLFFTNGVTEAFRVKGTRSGYSAFQQLLQDIGAVKPEKMKDGILEAMESHKAGKAEEDDEAFLVFHGR
jgi:sigma-B regulation protein RsbU (phosphoserine phosphatase)